MKFLLKLIIAGGIMSPLMAAPNTGLPEPPSGTDSVHVADNMSNGLDYSYPIVNPYQNSIDKPFTIADKQTDETARTAEDVVVSCGGRHWRHGELLGRTGDNKPVYVRIQDDRIYLNWDGVISSNIWILFNLQGQPFRDGTNDGPMIDACVNPVDPSTSPGNMLGRTGDGKITCNGYVMEHNDMLGTFKANWGNTYQRVAVVNGMLRVAIQQGDDDTRTTNYNMSLLGFTIQGADGSYLADKWKGKLTTQMVNACFWPIVPKPAQRVTSNTCNSGPTVNSVSNVSQTGLRFTFDGSGVGSVKWSVKLNGSEQRSGTASTPNETKTVNLSYASLNPGTYTLEIQGGSCTSTTSSRSFVVNAPVVGTPDCQNGPSLSEFTGVGPSNLTVNFGGSNLRVFSWRILSGSATVANGKTPTLNSNSTQLTFNYLNNGTYQFELTPEDCKASKVTRNFTVSANDTRSACPKGPSLERILGNSDSGLEFLFDGNEIYAIDWKIMQGNTVMSQNRVAPQDNNPDITFPRLATGEYTLMITGGNCESQPTTKRFGVNTALPIYVANFQGEVVEKGVELTWEVVAEQDGKEFEVLRYDSNLKSEEVLGKVSLTDQRVGKYRFIDESPLLGVNYYQLKQIDIDGSFIKSKIVSVNPGLISGTVLAPNPAQDYVDVQLTSRTAGSSQYGIYNASGIEVSKAAIQINKGKNVHRVNVKRLTSGNYFMRISHGGETTKLRFTKID